MQFVNLFKDFLIMQTAIELRENLIEKINSTDDVALLEELLLVIDFESNSDDVYRLNPEELAAVKDGIAQIESGRFFSNEEANKIFDKRLAR
jgi:hypothetical protein